MTIFRELASAGSCGFSLSRAVDEVGFALRLSVSSSRVTWLAVIVMANRAGASAIGIIAAGHVL